MPVKTGGDNVAAKSVAGDSLSPPDAVQRPYGSRGSHEDNFGFNPELWNSFHAAAVYQAVLHLTRAFPVTGSIKRRLRSFKKWSFRRVNGGRANGVKGASC